jgi:peptide subunit release factor 1 (eRF1)
MKESVDFSVHFFEENKVRRVLICGTDENVKAFRNLLPKAWQSLVVGVFPMSMTASHIEVLNRALEIGREAEQRREAHLVDDLVTLAAKGGNAVTGLEPTLQAISQGRVQSLILLEGFRKRGYFCKEHGILSVHRENSEGSCGDTLEMVGDVVELGVSQVLRTGGAVEMITANPALEKAGSIGAVLRF